MLNATTNASLFLINIVFQCYMIIILLRLFLQYIHADYYNPICQFVIQLTDKPLKPLRKIIPGYKGFDFAIVFLLFLTSLIYNILYILLLTASFPSILALLILSITTIIDVILTSLFWCILIRAILSFFVTYSNNDIIILLHQITEPVLKPIRKYIPLIANIDFSPFIAIILIQLLNIFIVQQLQFFSVTSL